MRAIRKHAPLLTTAAVCATLYAAAALHYPNFASPVVFVNFFADNSFLGIAAVGMTLVIISGGIDLSVGAVLGLCSVVMAVLMGTYGFSPATAIAAALAIGAGMGFATGCVVRYLGIAPFIVTLAGMFLARGLALIISEESIPIQNSFYSWITQLGLPLGRIQIPITAIIFLGVVGLGVYISAYTPFGRNAYAIGGNEEASVLMGLPVGRTKMLLYTFSGFCSALAAVVFTFYQSSGNATAGAGMELDAIAIVVIGGTLLTGGAGSVFGTLIGTLTFGIIQTAIIFQGTLNSCWTRVTVGALLLAFIVLQKLLSRSVYSEKAG